MVNIQRRKAATNNSTSENIRFKRVEGLVIKIRDGSTGGIPRVRACYIQQEREA